MLSPVSFASSRARRCVSSFLIFKLMVAFYHVVSTILPFSLRLCESGSFREGVFVLPVADDQHLLSAAFPDHEFESVRARIDRDERSRTVIVLA